MPGPGMNQRSPEISSFEQIVLLSASAADVDLASLKTSTDDADLLLSGSVDEELNGGGGDDV